MTKGPDNAEATADAAKAEIAAAWSCFGQLGFGKSMVVKRLASRVLDQRHATVHESRSGEYMPPLHALGAEPLTIGEQTSLRLNPLDPQTTPHVEEN